MEYEKWNNMEKRPTLWRYFIYRKWYYYNHGMLFDERHFLFLVDNEHRSNSFDYWHLLYLHIIKKILMPQSVIHKMLYMKHPTRLKILQGVFLCSDICKTARQVALRCRFPMSWLSVPVLGFLSLLRLRVLFTLFLKLSEPVTHTLFLGGLYCFSAGFCPFLTACSHFARSWLYCVAIASALR